MATEMADDGDPLTPEAAFSVLGDETRLQILRALGEADGALAFSDLYERVEYDDTANFSYHLEKLVGHFVRETDDGYTLRKTGRRIVEAILSGAITENPVLERRPMGTPCLLCGGEMEMSYRDEVLVLYCTDCGGTRGSSSVTVGDSTESTDDMLGAVGLPPAGVHGRSPGEILRAAEIWSVAKGQALTRGVCPRCSAPVERTVDVCENHDVVDGRCERCDQRFAVTTHVACTNCIAEGGSAFTGYLLGTPSLMGFMIDHGLDPINPDGFHLANFEEDVVSTEPFEARYTFTADDEAICLTVDDDLAVTDVVRSPVADSRR